MLAVTEVNNLRLSDVKLLMGCQSHQMMMMTTMFLLHVCTNV